MVCQTDRIAEGVDLPFPLMHPGFHLRQVGVPAMVWSGVVRVEEGIRIGIEQDAGKLAADHSGKHGLQLRILVRKADIGPHLRPGVPEPHGVEIARIYDRILAVVRPVIADRGIERVREAVFEHPGQLAVGQHRLYAVDLRINHRRAEQPFFDGRAAAVVGFDNPGVVGLRGSL